MLVIPAIDLLEGRAVRLREGKRDQVTVYRDDPTELARELVAAGAERIHVVDLDGAFAGGRRHAEAIAALCAASSVPVQVGGGLRDRAALDACFAAGARLGVLGTAAVKDPDFAESACRAYPGRIVVAVDAKNGRVAVEGWVEESELSALELGRRAASWGAAALLYTDVARDGIQTGPNVEATAALHDAVGIPVIASGGISSLDDLRRLDAAGVPMAVVGRALYEGNFTVADAIAAVA